MKITKFYVNGKKKTGLVDGNFVYDLNAIDNNIPVHLRLLIQDFAKYKDKITNLDIKDGNRYPISEVKFAIPVSIKNKIIGIGLNYKMHAEEVHKDVQEYPTYFCRYHSSLSSANEVIKLPTNSNKVDYEGELAVIIGKPCKNVAEENVMEHIFGYSIFNDITVRDFQKKSTQWLAGKNFDKLGSFGPYIVPKEYVADDFLITTKIDGKILQNEFTSNMIFGIKTLISKLSEVMELHPGDVIATGTPSGVGYIQNPPLYLRPNMLCEIEISGVGVLSNNFA